MAQKALPNLALSIGGIEFLTSKSSVKTTGVNFLASSYCTVSQSVFRGREVRGGNQTTTLNI